MTDPTCPLPSASDTLPDTELVPLLAGLRRIAIVGASPNPTRTSHQIAEWLITHTPYEVFLVNPRGGDADILGHGFFPDLKSLPARPQIVNVFRRGEDTPPIADAAVAAKADLLWLQLGISNLESQNIAQTAGISYVQNRCIKVEYLRLQDDIEQYRADGK